MRRHIVSFLRKASTLQVVVNTLGNYLNIAFTAVYAVLLVRYMPPAEFGVLTVLLGVSYVVASIFDLGTTGAIFSHVPSLHKNAGTRKKLYEFIKTNFFYQCVVAGFATVILGLAFPYLDKVFFKTGVSTSVLLLTALTTLFFAWQNFALHVLYAAQKFLAANTYLNVTHVIKIALILFLIATKTVAVGSVIFIFGVVGPFLFFLLFILQNREQFLLFLKAGVKRGELKLGFTATYFIATQFFGLGLRMDIFLLSFYGLSESVGYYGLSQRIILAVATTVVSITQVLTPQFARLTTKEEARKEARHGLLYLLVPVGLFIILSITPTHIFNFVFTQGYEKSVGITRSLIIPYILFAVANLPLTFVLYTAKKPSVVLFAYIIFFVSVTAGCLWLIPSFGVFGPSYALTIAYALMFGILTWGSIVEYKKLPEKAP